MELKRWFVPPAQHSCSGRTRISGLRIAVKKWRPELASARSDRWDQQGDEVSEEKKAKYEEKQIALPLVGTLQPSMRIRSRLSSAEM